MYCPKCGTKVSDNANYCYRCGIHIKNYILKHYDESPAESSSDNLSHTKDNNLEEEGFTKDIHTITKDQIRQEMEEEILKKREEILKKEGKVPEETIFDRTGSFEFQSIDELFSAGNQKEKGERIKTWEDTGVIEGEEKNDFIYEIDPIDHHGKKDGEEFKPPSREELFSEVNTDREFVDGDKADGEETPVIEKIRKMGKDITEKIDDWEEKLGPFLQNTLSLLGGEGSKKRNVALVFYSIITLLPLLLFIRNFHLMLGTGPVIFVYFVAVFLALIHGIYRLIILALGLRLAKGMVDDRGAKKPALLMTAIIIGLLELIAYLPKRTSLFGFPGAILSSSFLTEHPFIFFFHLILGAFLLINFLYRDISKKDRLSAMGLILLGEVPSAIVLNLVGITVLKMLINALIPGLIP
ncbi:MAG: zinc-ribbon domain-containing protein [Tissierellia bacterium]|nr:zinc-ribbon domain-containing protein [Tissierellia bacterium]